MGRAGGGHPVVQVRLLTPWRERTTANAAHEHALADARLVIDSVFASLKEQMRLEHHLAAHHANWRKESRNDSSHSGSSSTHSTDDQSGALTVYAGHSSTSIR